MLPLGGPLVVVVHADDVADVLARDEEFTISEVNGERIGAASGPFVLGWDAGPDYDREDALLRAAVRPGDIDRIADLTAELAAAQLAGAVRVDAVAGYARPIAVELVQRWLGVTHPDPVTLGHWLRALFDGCFVTSDRRAKDVTARIAPQFGDHLLSLIDEARTHGPDTDTVLGRMVDLAGQPGWEWVDDDAIRRNIAGLAVGAVDTTSKATALVLEELMRRPDQLADAGAAHAAGETDRVWAHVVECLRWNPHQPLLARHARESTTLDGRTVSPGTSLLVITAAAAFDPAAVEAPRDYRIDRDAEAVRPFGAGLHECFGRLVNQATLPALVGPVAARTPHRVGHMSWDGSFPDHLILDLTTGP
jgi:cytochrome P450